MAQTTTKAEFIRIPTTPGRVQTHPVEPEQRIPSSEISLAPCDVSDADKIAEGLYTCFPESWWTNREPPSLRPPEQSTRQKRLAARLGATFYNPTMKWMKAVLTSTNTIVGIAGWMTPGNPIHNVWRKSAVSFYGLDKHFDWTPEEFEEMWKGVDLEAWDGRFAIDDGVRAEVMGDEPHWYLAPLITWPEYQGRGVGKLLLDWAIKQADATDPVTPMYLESAPYARAVYMHVGFVPQGDYNFVRRGPAVVKGLEAEEGSGKPEVEVKVVEQGDAEAVAIES